MIFRPTLALAKRLHVTFPSTEGPVTAPHVDWCAHAFTADRHRYVIVTNTHSLFSIVTPGAGMTTGDVFVRRVLAAIREHLCDSGRGLVWERHLAPATGVVQFAKIPDRRVMGSMNELIFMAKVHLIEGGLSPFDVSGRINETPMSHLWKRGAASAPVGAFDQMASE